MANKRFNRFGQNWTGSWYRLWPNCYCEPAQCLAREPADPLGPLSIAFSFHFSKSPYLFSYLHLIIFHLYRVQPLIHRNIPHHSSIVLHLSVSFWLLTCTILAETDSSHINRSCRCLVPHLDLLVIWARQVILYFIPLVMLTWSFGLVSDLCLPAQRRIEPCAYAGSPPFPLSSSLSTTIRREVVGPPSH